MEKAILKRLHFIINSFVGGMKLLAFLFYS